MHDAMHLCDMLLTWLMQTICTLVLHDIQALAVQQHSRGTIEPTPTLTLQPQAAPSLKGGLIRHLRLQPGLPRPCCCAGASPAWPMQLPGLCPSCPCPGGLLAQRLYALQGHVEPGLGAEQPALQCKKWSELLCSTGSGLSCHGDGSMSDLSCRQDVLEGQQAPSCSAPVDKISADVPAIGGQC